VFKVPSEIEVEVTVDQLKAFIKSAIGVDVDIEVKGDRVYMVVPMDMLPTEAIKVYVRDGRIYLRISTSIQR